VLGASKEDTPCFTLKSTLFSLFSLLSSSYAAPKTGKHGNSILRTFTHRAPRIDLSVIPSRDFEKQRRASFKTQKPRTKRHRDLSLLLTLISFPVLYRSIREARVREGARDKATVVKCIDTRRNKTNPCVIVVAIYIFYIFMNLSHVPYFKHE